MPLDLYTTPEVLWKNKRKLEPHWNKKNFCSGKDTFKRMKRQVTHWEKISEKTHLIKGLMNYMKDQNLAGRI